MTERDLSDMSDADLRSHLEHFCGIKAFWDDNERREVRDFIARIEAEIAKRGAM